MTDEELKALEEKAKAANDKWEGRYDVGEEIEPAAVLSLIARLRKAEERVGAIEDASRYAEDAKRYGF